MTKRSPRMVMRSSCVEPSPENRRSACRRLLSIVALLPLDLAANTLQVRRGIVVERAVRIDARPQRAQQRRKLIATQRLRHRTQRADARRQVLRRLLHGDDTTRRHRRRARAAAAALPTSSAVPAIRAFAVSVPRIKQRRHRRAHPGGKADAHLRHQCMLLRRPWCWRSRAQAPSATLASPRRWRIATSSASSASHSSVAGLKSATGSGNGWQQTHVLTLPWCE